jgi:hypothetical protein
MSIMNLEGWKYTVAKTVVLLAISLLKTQEQKNFPDFKM